MLFQVIILLFVTGAEAQQLTPAETFAKCYERLTDYPVDIDSTLYKDVVAKKIAPITACMSVFDTAKFVKSGSNRSLANKNDEVARAILRNFHQFHLTWFTHRFSNDLLNLSFYGDVEEHGLFITDALFSNLHYKSVTTATKPLRGLREGVNFSPYIIHNTNLTTRVVVAGPMKNPTSVTPRLTIDKNYAVLPKKPGQVGELLGIQDGPSTVIPAPFNLARPTLARDVASLDGTVLDEASSYELNPSFGGGLLGSVSYLLSATETNATKDGGNTIYRRWASDFMNDMMCVSFPSLPETSVAVKAEHSLFTKPGVSQSELPFRTSTTCLSCHTTLDNFAHSARNIQFRQSMGNTDLGILRDPDKPIEPNASTLMVPVKYKVISPAVAISDKDRQYFRRPPAGRLVYRNHKAAIVDKAVNGLADLGAKASEEEDFYVCAAKRYYSYLTGIDIPLTPITEADLNKRKDFEAYHRKQINQLGKDFKTHGSLRTLIVKIMSTPAFQSRNPAEVGGQ